ncbi:MAG: recombinase family protein [Candidatus Pacearchaeota archaeon]|jgi:DNA invertase Pin-like site-specific DNA recombinase
MEELEKLKQENFELKKEIEKLKNLLNNRGKTQKSGMIKKASSGKVMSKPAFGYKIEFGKLIKDSENAKKVQEIFSEFLINDISLNKLSKKYNFSVNGLKKILTNFTYIGKIKFDNSVHEGTHEPIISSTDFNHVQDKLEKMLKKN